MIYRSIYAYPEDGDAEVLMIDYLNTKILFEE